MEFYIVLFLMPCGLKINLSIIFNERYAAVVS
jgi:hypothetical protein